MPKNQSLPVQIRKPLIRHKFLTYPTLSLVTVAVFGLLLVGKALAAVTITEYPVITSGAQVESITKGPDGNLWFVEYNDGQIGKITTGGTVTEYTVPTGSGLSGPREIVSGPNGNLWFTENGTGKIGEVTTSGSFSEFNIPTSSSQPTGIVSGPDGNLWFTETNTNKIGKITTGGTVTEYTLPNSNSQPSNIVSGPDGNLWFTEYSYNKIGKITPSGTITEYQVASDTQPGIDGIAVGSDGNLWMTETIDNKVIKVNTSGTVLGTYNIPTATAAPTNIATGPDGDLWFTESAVAKIGRVTTAGTMLEYAVPTSNTGVNGITAGPDGNVWFGENDAKVGKIILPTASKPGNTNQTVDATIGTPITVNVVSGVSGSPAASTLKITSGPSHGTASVNLTAGTITYTPTAGYSGTDSLTYELCSSADNGVCSETTLTFDVTAAAPDTGFGVYTSNPLRTLSIFGLGASSLVGLALVSRKYRKN